RVDPAVPHGRDALEALPRRERLAAGAAREDHLGTGIEDLLPGNEGRERSRGGEDVASSADPHRVAEEVGAAHRQHRPGPDPEKNRHAAPVRVALAQPRGLAFEFAGARLGEPPAAAELADLADDARDIRKHAHLGDEYGDSDALEPGDLQGRVAA